MQKQIFREQLDHVKLDIEVSVSKLKSVHAKRFSKQEREEIVNFVNIRGWGGKIAAMRKYGVSYCALNRWSGITINKRFSTDRCVPTFDLSPKPQIRSLPVNHPDNTGISVTSFKRTSDSIMNDIKYNEGRIKYIVDKIKSFQNRVNYFQKRNRDLALELGSVFK